MEMSAMDLLMKCLLLGGYHLGAAPFLRVMIQGFATMSKMDLQQCPFLLCNFGYFYFTINKLEKIELVRQPGGHYKLDHAITATQKVILGAFGIDEDSIRARAVLVGKELANAAKPEKGEKLWKLKERCDKVSSELDKLYEEKVAMENQERLSAIGNSQKTRAEILAFLESK